MLKRRKKKKTDYKQRLGLLKSGKFRLVVRRSLNNIHVQIIKYEPAGDKTLIEVSSKNLKKYGWKGHCGNLPSAYLCGLLAGLKAIKKDIDKVVLDIGLQASIRGSSIYAVAVGARDAGLPINIDEDTVPDMDRISGAHISNYARSLKPDPEKYRRHFSMCLKNELDPEKIPEHFDEVKNKMLEEFGFSLKYFEKKIEKETKKPDKKVSEKEEEKKTDEIEKEKTESVPPTVKEKKTDAAETSEVKKEDTAAEETEDEEEWEDVE